MNKGKRAELGRWYGDKGLLRAYRDDFIGVWGALLSLAGLVALSFWIGDIVDFIAAYSLV